MDGYLLIKDTAYGPYDLDTVMKILAYKDFNVIYAFNVNKVTYDYGNYERTYLCYDSYYNVNIKKKSLKDRRYDSVNSCAYLLYTKDLKCPAKTIAVKRPWHERHKSRVNTRYKVPKHFWKKVKCEAELNDIPEEYKPYIENKTRYPHRETPLWWDEFGTHRKSNNWKEHRKTQWKYCKPSYRVLCYENSEFSEREESEQQDTEVIERYRQ